MDSPPPRSSDSSGDLQLFGLPERTSAAGGRDPIEAAASEFLDLVRRGNAPPLEDYIRRFPGCAEQLRELLPLALAMESWKNQREISDFRARLAAGTKLDRLGEFRILREIGRGGMGIVYEAEQESMGRRVAVKVLPSRFTQNEQGRQRFLREARTAAALRHQHIVPVFSYGEHDGLCYYAMQLIEGIGLDKAIACMRQGDGVLTAGMLRAGFAAGSPVEENEAAKKNENLAGTPAKPPVAGPTAAGAETPDSRILKRGSWLPITKLIIQVCHALRHAHAQGTLHRDIKPANLLLDLSGRIWLADFGLAQDVQQMMSAPTGPGGTPRYMAPEQLTGQVDQRSDVYSLGVTLYELCTLRPAFEGTSREELIRAVQNGKYVRPRKIESKLPVPLETIILKAIARRPEDRYDSTGALMADLLAFIKRAQSPHRPQGLGRLLRFLNPDG